jgi:TM2 domain-containing membrane protein YozV
MNCANHPDRERTAFCQNCGKPLCQECTRIVGSAVYCEPCLAAKLAGAPSSTQPGGYPSSGYPYGSGSDQVNYVVDGVIPPPPVPGAPSPGLATLLGFIPGVGAMYNGQYAKGIVHLVVFAILVSLASDVNGIFGLFVAGWVIYQAIDANHTARARLAGAPLPNPFGLNDLGERLGFGKSWPAAAPYNPANPYSSVDPATGTPAADPAAPPAGAYAPPTAQYPPYTPPASNWGAPPESYNYSVPPVPPMPPYSSPYTADNLDPNAAANFGSRHRLPSGAIWMIGLGLFFLIANTGIFHGFSRHFVPFLLIGVGVWVFIRKMTDTGGGLADDGTPQYRMRLFSALRGAIWILLVGVLFLLADLHILSWGHSWPLFIIVAGLMTVFQRAVYSNAYAGYPYQPPVPPAPNPPAATSTSIVPVSHDPDSSNHNDQEGR